MFDEPVLLLERTIHNLEVLSELLVADADVPGSAYDHVSPAPNLLAASVAITVALPALKAASDTWRGELAITLRARSGCVNCED